MIPMEDKTYTGSRDVKGESNPTKPNEYKLCWRPTKNPGHMLFWVLLHSKGNDTWNHIASAVQVVYGGLRIPSSARDTGAEVYHNIVFCQEIIEFALNAGDFHHPSVILSKEAVFSNFSACNEECTPTQIKQNPIGLCSSISDSETITLEATQPSMHQWSKTLRQLNVSTMTEQ